MGLGGLLYQISQSIDEAMGGQRGCWKDGYTYFPYFALIPAINLLTRVGLAFFAAAASGEIFR